MPNEEKYISITITLPEDYIEWLEQQMVEKDLNRSQIIRAAIRQLQTNEEKEEE